MKNTDLFSYTKHDNDRIMRIVYTAAEMTGTVAKNVEQ
jgi:hypothetical protein